MATTRRFYEDWSGYSVGTLPSGTYSQDGTRNFPQIVSSSVDGVTGCYIGNRMLRSAYNDTVPDSANDRFQCAVLESMASLYTNEFLIRLIHRFDQNMAVDTKLYRWYTPIPDTYWGTGSGFSNGLKNEGFDGGSWVTYYGGGDPNGDGSAPGASSFTDTSARYTAWQELSYYFNYNGGSSGGITKAWSNGHLMRNTTGRTFGAKFTDFYTGSNGNDGAHAIGYSYLGEIQFFADTAGGTATTGNMSDNTVQVVGGSSNVPPLMMGHRYQGMA